MQLLPWLPKFLHRHKVLNFACRFGLQESVLPIEYNSSAKTVIDLRDPEPRNVFINKEFEPDFFDLASSFLGENGTFFDLGANVGFCSFGLAPTHQRVEFHLFEANPNLITLLNQSIDLHPNQSFHLNHCCISDTHGKTNFMLEGNQSGQSHVSPAQGRGIEVPNLVLDEYCEQNQISCIDFAKIDLEGHELPSLQGWEKCLSAHRVNALYIEIMPQNQARYGRETIAPLTFIESLGYSLYLCKDSDFGHFGDKPKCIHGNNVSPLLAKFNASEYPDKFATDILAIGPD